jgi:hypothetical protein
MHISKLLLLLMLLVSSASLGSAFYDPTLGRWINRDPLGESAHSQTVAGDNSVVPLESMLQASLHPFTVINNSPIDNIDPFGLKVFVIGRLVICTCYYSCTATAGPPNARFNTIMGQWFCDYPFFCTERGVGCTGTWSGAKTVSVAVGLGGLPVFPHVYGPPAGFTCPAWPPAPAGGY